MSLRLWVLCPLRSFSHISLGSPCKHPPCCSNLIVVRLPTETRCHQQGIGELTSHSAYSLKTDLPLEWIQYSPCTGHSSRSHSLTFMCQGRLSSKQGISLNLRPLCALISRAGWLVPKLRTVIHFRIAMVAWYFYIPFLTVEAHSLRCQRCLSQRWSNRATRSIAAIPT